MILLSNCFQSVVEKYGENVELQWVPPAIGIEAIEQDSQRRLVVYHMED